MCIGSRVKGKRERSRLDLIFYLEGLEPLITAQGSSAKILKRKADLIKHRRASGKSTGASVNFHAITRKRHDT